MAATAGEARRGRVEKGLSRAVSYPHAVGHLRGAVHPGRPDGVGRPGGRPGRRRPAVEAAAAPPPDAAAAPGIENLVESSPPATTKSPDGWTLNVSAKDETQMVIQPLTTAISTREYEVGGLFNGSMTGPAEEEPPQGTLEVGYQIGCGIDMSTSNGVVMSGSLGLTPRPRPRRPWWWCRDNWCPDCSLAP